ncbi:hypothetical protein [Weissella confusa]|uniref:hypothetical protein n=2 Tax=Weissella confusa TaxID=1583 RepID=UPI00223B0B48|nr:hypothetical protein [Weissella confusa]
MFVFIGTVLMYTDFGQTAQGIKLVGQAVGMVVLLKQFDWRDYWHINLIWGGQTVWPLILVAVGIYTSHQQTIVMFAIFAAFQLLWATMIGKYFSTNPGTLLRLCQKCLLGVLTLMCIIHRTVIWRIDQLFVGMMTNTRYGDQAVGRTSLMFVNVNALGIFATLLAVISLWFIFKRDARIRDWFGIVLAAVLILNAGSRAALVVTVLATLWLKSHSGIKKFLVGTLISILFCYTALLITNNHGGFALMLDDLSSHRISFGQTAVHSMFTQTTGLVGNGPVGTAYAAEHLFKYLGGIAVDNTVAFVIYSTGILGIIWFVTMSGWLIAQTIAPVARYLLFVIGSYAVFEHVWLVPSAPLSVMLLPVILGVMNGKEKRGNQSIGCDTDLQSSKRS